MDLSNSPLGIKRRLQIVGFLEWNNIEKFLICQFYIQSIDANGVLLTDKEINKNREVRYALTNLNRVNASFNTVASGGTGEYDYFFDLVSTTPLPTIITQLATKLNSRGLFN